MGDLAENEQSGKLSGSPCCDLEITGGSDYAYQGS